MIFCSFQIRTSIYATDGKLTLLQRRLGVIVGAVVGFFVFIVLITTMICVKFRKKRVMRQQVRKLLNLF